MTPSGAPPVRGLTLIATAALCVEDPRAGSANRPSFYADPVAWLTTSTVARALRAEGAGILHTPDEVGVIAMSETCTRPTMETIAGAAGRSRVSPLKFAGANPGLLAGLPCIQWTFRGPSLVFAMAPDTAADTALSVAEHWLSSGQARYAVCVAHAVRDGAHHTRCVILGGPHASDAGPAAHASSPARIRALLAEPGAAAATATVMASEQK
ncbi:beta-ketoacyl synthase N-terminal-like domain-containing protein [Streptomyces sp. CB03238]|uniref:beta-ketoacyl synthase N-terminal-like domain-containing protein n=1 Tax=Streptomyces sp. CB03238 TaxID=1907777 RepID=UPI000A104E19|nr:beta-ketoacyl synthase N-terminal-like domain-containing protein [Streptomyces sp. CB03238]ORT56735.1 hypothetical protein BKD26_26515 [Streptomyces sp. CB03238]